MSPVPLPLLSLGQVTQAKTIGESIRSGEVAALVGAGLSVGAGLPDWTLLTHRLILSWKGLDPSWPAQQLSAENYVRFVRKIFGDNDLAFVSYLRRTSMTLAASGGKQEQKSFGELLFRALYSDPLKADQFLFPPPNDLHRHLVALFARHPAHLWTTNYDDLLERAGRDLGLQPEALHLTRHRSGRGLLVTHLHGFLPPVPPGIPVTKDAVSAPVVLAEDDYHAIAANSVNTAWIGHEFHRLFEEHRVLILGMSMTDPNLRRVLATLAQVGQAEESDHWAVLTPISAADLPLKRIHERTKESLVKEAVRSRSSYWDHYGLKTVDVGHHDQILPFVLRLRYESAGDSPGDLWRRAAELGWTAVSPRAPETQSAAQTLLADILAELGRQFNAPASEIVDLGLFLVHPQHLCLELVFRAGQSPPTVPGGRVFSIDPDAPTGMAGCVFVTGSALRIGRQHVGYDYNAPASAVSTSAPYEGLIVVPLVDWPSGGVPLGTIYVTTSSTRGVLFQQDENELTAWLQRAGLTVLASLSGR